MPLTYTIDPTLRLVTFDLGPEIPSLAEVRRALDELISDRRFRPGFAVLVDGRHLYVERDYERQSLSLLTARLSLNSDAIRWALLTSNLATYRERQFAETYARSLGIDYRVFMVRGKAMNWVLALRGAA